MVSYRMLGALEVSEDGRVADLGPPKQRALLAILLLHANEIVPIDQLIDLLWGERPPRAAQHAVQVYVSELRAALQPIVGADTIVWRAPGYLLTVETDAIDARRLERLAHEGTDLLEQGDDKGAEFALRSALDQWHGPPLADFTYEEFAQPAIRQLTGTWLQATESLAAAELGLGHDHNVLTLAEAASREDPLRERPRELQMRALVRVGRHAEAMRIYEAFAQLLEDEVGVSPSPALADLQERILLRDASLWPAPPVGPATGAPRNPFKGLRPFVEADAADFFGRDTLVGRLISALEGGARLLALVGPSGCGKSSLLHAGLIPALRRSITPGGGHWIVTPVRPGADPAQALDGALSGAPLGGSGTFGAAAPSLGPGDRITLVIDQFEEVFASDEAAIERTLSSLAGFVADPSDRVRVVLALRADAYDRPLLHAQFATSFVSGVVNVMPMTAAELEDAVVGPARRVGVEVDPALLAELISDTVHEPGALPLLQHTLALLFDRTGGATLGLEDYDQLGGLQAALSTRATAVFEGLDEERRRVARQVFLRLVRLGDGAPETARRAPVRELATLGVDPVALSDVLAAFDKARLISIDRDPLTGGAAVEVAHEKLLKAWDRLAGWIEEHRADLARQAFLARRCAEWEAAGERPEDLLAGSRLDELAAWSRVTMLWLSDDERAFLDTSQARRDADLAGEAARAARTLRTERRARLRLAGLIGAVAALIAAIVWAFTSWPGPAPEAVLVYQGRDGGGMADRIEVGFDQGVEATGVDAQRVVVAGRDELESQLGRLARQGVKLIVVGYAWSNAEVERAARDHPGTWFLASDYAGDLPNVSMPRLARHEGAFLVGLAAALRTQTGIVGIVNDMDANYGWQYTAGFAAGAREVDPDTIVLTRYLSDLVPEPQVSFGTVGRTTRELYRLGADVVFYTGDMAPLAVFEAAYADTRSLGRHLWAVAIDTDWYVVLPLVGASEASDPRDWRPHVLTSLITRHDIAVAAMLDDYAQGGLSPGPRPFGLADGAFDLSTSGGFLDGVWIDIARQRDRVVAGEIAVPDLPDDRGPPR